MKIDIMEAETVLRIFDTVEAKATVIQVSTVLSYFSSAMKASATTFLLLKAIPVLFFGQG